MLYTKCPACGAALGFEPQNEGDWTQKLRCPACGKTLCVKMYADERAQAAENTTEDAYAHPANGEELENSSFENAEEYPVSANEEDDVAIESAEDVPASEGEYVASPTEDENVAAAGEYEDAESLSAEEIENPAPANEEEYTSTIPAQNSEAVDELETQTKVCESQSDEQTESVQSPSDGEAAEQGEGNGGKGEKDGAPKKKKRVSSILKNVVCAALSLGFIGLSVACYLSIKGVFVGGNEFNSFYNGIYLWELLFTYPEYFAASFGAGVGWGLAELLPMFIFTLSCVDFIVCVIGIFLKRYGKTYHLLLGAAICAMSVALVFVPYINIVNVDASIGVANDLTISQYFTSIFNPQYTTLYFAPAIGVVRLICAILFALRFKKRKKEM